jgi:hypothetical protein
MYHRAFQTWQRERDVVEEEMNRLITTSRWVSAEERRVRRFQFEALIERREAAARILLQSDRAIFSLHAEMSARAQLTKCRS